MEWFSNWWDSLVLLEQILYCIAAPATLVLIIQIIMIFLGAGDGGEGFNPSDTSGFDGTDFSGADVGTDFADATDINVDGGNPADFTSMRFFTLQGVITFLCVFGWSALGTYAASRNVILTFIIALVLGAAAMLGVAKIIQLSAKLAQNGNLDVKNLLGENGTVYIPIPANAQGTGKVMVSVGERLVEYDAVTEDSEPIASNTPIRVTDIRSETLLVVEKSL